VEALAALGLSSEEAKLYRVLVAMGGTEVDELANRCQLSSAEVGGSLVALEAQGLVAQSAATPGRWVAAPPGIALRALVNDRRHELEQAELVAARLAEVHRTDAAGSVHDLVEVVVGASAVGQRFHQLQLGAVEEVCVLVTDEPTAVPATENQAEDIAAARGVRYRIVLERDVLEQTSQSELVAVMRRNEEVRVSDRVPTKLVIADRRTAMVPLDADSPDPAALVIHATGLVQSLLSLFDFVWRDAWPLQFASPDRDDVVQAAPGPDEIDLQVLSLLIAGASDALVARQLDVGLRTIQRRVRSLMDATGATSRIQLGWAAYENGWLRRP
jgi:sugar-specific transcriptional regulator TrmB